MQETIRTLLEQHETWAVVGCSPDPRRDSHRIAGLLQSRGKRMIPVNPASAGGEIHGERAYASLLDLPDGVGVDVVDIFRRSDQAGAHVDEAIAIGARAVWMQLGVIDRAAAARAVEAGLLVVMDRCPGSSGGAWTPRAPCEDGSRAHRGRDRRLEGRRRRAQRACADRASAPRRRAEPEREPRRRRGARSSRAGVLRRGDAPPAILIAPQDPVPLLRTLAAARVDHVVIGGFAVISYGVVRATKDLDVCPAPDRANLERLARCLSDLEVVQMGAGDVDEAEMPFDPTRPEDLAQGGNFRLESSLGVLDVMQWVSGIDADHAYAVLGADAVDAEVEGVRVRICSLAHLRAMKRAAGRPQDLQDLADLAIAHAHADGEERPR